MSARRLLVGPEAMLGRHLDGRVPQRGPARKARVLLVSMPFGLVYSPSLALGILRARLREADIDAECRHFTIDYAARIGVDAYNRIASGFPSTTSLLGEWIFSHALNRRSQAQQEAYLLQTFGDHDPSCDGGNERAAYLERELRLKSLEHILRLASQAGAFVDEAAREIVAQDPDVVGLTSVFEQNVASIALARRLRALSPSVTIIFGGANCEGEMGRELALRYPFIDLVISGEADRVIVPLVTGVAKGLDWEQNDDLLPLLDRRASAGSFLQTLMVQTLDDGPRAEFDSYFADLSKHPSIAAKLDVQIPMESSRGCWWGAKHHCTFCGLNGATMAFRSKAPSIVVGDVRASAVKYPGRKICFVDNIMDRGYFGSVLSELARHESGAELFYEIKSNVSRAEVRALRDAGVRRVQPGIESLSDRVLQLMKKGVSTIQNLQLLKWCTEFGIRVDWNILWGFPGELPEDYQAMARMIPLLLHFEPPTRGTRIRLDRHSPNFRQADAFGFRRVRPYSSYRHVYDDLPSEAIANLAYFFEADHDLDRNIDEYTQPLKDGIDFWHRSHRSSGLFSLASGDTTLVVDSRLGDGKCRYHTLSPLSATVLRLCDVGQSERRLAGALPDVPGHQIRTVLEGLVSQGLIWTDGLRHLSLTVSLDTYLESRRSARLDSGIDAMLTASPE